MARLWTTADTAAEVESREDSAYAPHPASNDAANYGYGHTGADDVWSRWPEAGSNDAANYGYGRQGVDGYAGGYAPAEGSNDAANYGYGRDGANGKAGGYSPPAGSNDAANYGYGREGVDDDAARSSEATVLRVIDDLAIWAGADPTLPTGGAIIKEDSMSDSKSEDVRKQLSSDWMVDASNIAIAVRGDEAVLTGTVPTSVQRERAQDRAMETSGISRVRNELEVAAPAYG